MDQSKDELAATGKPNSGSFFFPTKETRGELTFRASTKRMSVLNSRSPPVDEGLKLLGPWGGRGKK
jgi:hypothetical protein